VKKKKIEILAPAKDLIHGMAAINSGADAVYIGAPQFGARSNAHNALEDVAALVKYAHLYYAQVFVVMNTILYDNELETCRKMIWELYDIGVDALIVQDMAIMEMDLPPIVLHASTQANNRDADKIKFFRERNNLSVEYVSIQIDVSAKYYCKIENGEVDLKISKLDKLVKTLGVKKSELFYNEVL
jgi:putative protease